MTITHIAPNRSNDPAAVTKNPGNTTQQPAGVINVTVG